MGLVINRSARRVWVLVGLIVCIVIGAGAPSAVANGYLLDPSLSLAGGCEKTTKLDPVEDPGCPGGMHPPKAFESPRSVATDFYGDIYVSSYGTDAENGKGGRIDVFSPSGAFLTELKEEEGPKDVAVDSKGNLYVYNAHSGGGQKLVRYVPSIPYEPLAGKVEYKSAGIVVAEGAFLNSVAITPSNDHVFLKRSSRVEEFGSAAEGNKVLNKSIGVGTLEGINGEGLAIDEAHNRIYAGNNGANIRIYELSPPHTLLDSVEPSDLPGGNLLRSPLWRLMNPMAGSSFLMGNQKKRSLTSNSMKVLNKLTM